jgi:HlyD family secretion protein
MHFISVRARTAQAWFRGLSGRWQLAVLTLAVVVLSAALSSLGGSGAGDQGLVSVTRGDISQTVSVTGRITAADNVELAFQNSGRIAQVSAPVGTRVVAGQFLASLDTGELYAQFRDAQANVAAQQARLDELTQGSRPEDISIKETELLKARQDLQNAYDNAYDVLSDALTKADNAVHIQLEDIFDEVGTIDYPSYKLTFSCFCDQLDLTVNYQRGQTEEALDQWQDNLNALSAGASTDVLLADLQNARGYLQTTKVMLENLSAVLNHPTVSLPADTAAEYRTGVSTARTGIIAAQTSVASQEQSILTYKLIADRVAGELAKLRNGSTTQALAVQQAQVQSAQAQADRISALIGKNIIRSPIRGIVTTMDAKVGQTATPGQIVATVISDQSLEIEANVPEVDVSKVAVGNAVAVTIDALPGETMPATVAFIDPAETIIDGVVNFTIKVLFTVSDMRLKSGLTANLDIESQRRSDVLLLPQFAIIENDDGTFVRRPDGSEVPVTTGIRSQDGMVEITSGLAVGDQVVNIGLKSAQ